ncbi:MAG: carboxypeptidase-like regulatory domain-containing protein [Acidobacteriota bacterium]|nr:carboxypeptidase-like regulatory domain-containing protein [Acidobacteriota bacterium]
MRKLIFATLIIAATSGAALAQEQQQSQPDASLQSMAAGPANMGRAPETPNGIGRLDLRVVDEAGEPIRGVNAKLESTRTDNYFCEAVSLTDARGVAQMTLHMGRLMLKLKAPGFQKQEIKLFASSLNEPVRVTMVRKK